MTKLKMQNLCETDCSHITEEMSRDIDRLLAEEIQSAECGPEGDGDEVNQAINAMVEHLITCDYAEEVALEAIFDALHEMLDSGAMTDIPSLNEMQEGKARWVEEFGVKIREKLSEMGLDLTPVDFTKVKF